MRHQYTRQEVEAITQETAIYIEGAGIAQLQWGGLGWAAGGREGNLMNIEKLIESLQNAAGGPEGIKMCHAAANALSTLRAENASLRKERDAAVEDVLDAAITPCSYCKHGPINGGICDMDNDNHEMFSCWEWRGPEEG